MSLNMDQRQGCPRALTAVPTIQPVLRCLIPTAQHPVSAGPSADRVTGNTSSTTIVRLILNHSWETWTFTVRAASSHYYVRLCAHDYVYFLSYWSGGCPTSVGKRGRNWILLEVAFLLSIAFQSITYTTTQSWYSWFHEQNSISLKSPLRLQRCPFYYQRTLSGQNCCKKSDR